MSGVGANQIRFGSGIASVNDEAKLRVYSQDINGAIREDQYSNGQWTGGTGKNIIAQAILGSPIAATSQTLQHIRVYYIGQGNTLKEVCYDTGRGWHDGPLNAKNFQVAPYSRLAASFLPWTEGDLRVYAQKSDNSIQEYVYNGKAKVWVEGKNIGQALPGTGLACAAITQPAHGLRVYLQQQNLTLGEQYWEAGKGWHTGDLSVTTASVRTGIAAASLDKGKLRVYFVDKYNTLKEKARDGNAWHDGTLSNACIPGSQVGVVHWGQGDSLHMRVYFQNGTQVSAVTEWVGNVSAWKLGKPALPPAH